MRTILFIVAALVVTALLLIEGEGGGTAGCIVVDENGQATCYEVTPERCNLLGGFPSRCHTDD